MRSNEIVRLRRTRQGIFHVSFFICHWKTETAEWGKRRIRHNESASWYFKNLRRKLLIESLTKK